MLKTCSSSCSSMCASSSHVCSVCLSVSAGHMYFVNFGARTCFKCRAFFRRAHQRSRVPSFVCRSNNECDVTVNSHDDGDAKCRKCRLDRCLAVGMRPELVLNSEQKSRRFKKFYQRKHATTKEDTDNQQMSKIVEENKVGMENKVGVGMENKTGMESRMASSSSSSSLNPKCCEEGVFLSSHSMLVLLSEMASPKIVLLEAPGSSSPLSLASSLPCDQDPWRSCSPSLRTSRMRHLMKKRLEWLTQSWEKSTHSVELKSSVKEHFLLVHKGDLSNLSLEVVKNLLVHWAAVFSDFALCQKGFVETVSSEWRRVIVENTAMLFVHYAVSQYITAKERRSQLTWVGLSDSNRLALLSSSYLLHVMGLFRHPTASTLYEKLSFDISLLLASIPESMSKVVMPIVALACLYHVPHFRYVLKEHFEDLLEVADWASQVYDLLGRRHLNSILDTLRSMESLFNECGSIITYSSSSSSSSCLNNVLKTPSLHFTVEEDLRLRTELARYESVVTEVPLEDELIREFVMYTYDVPLSRNFFRRSMLGLVERFRRFMVRTDWFTNLNQMDQIVAWRQSVMKAVAVFMAKMESMPNGNSQLKLISGITDVQNVFGVTNLKKLTMKDGMKFAGDAMAKPTEQYSTLSSNLASLLADDDNFKLLLFLVMFTSDNSGHQSQLFASGAREAELLIQRRFLAQKGLGECKASEELNRLMNAANALTDCVKALCSDNAVNKS